MKRTSVLKGTRILIVDDERSCSETLRHIIEADGADATIVEDAEAAIARISSGAFDAIIADIRLPGLDGLSLLGIVRKKDPDLPVIIITGFSSVSSAVEALNLGAEDYILKPVSDSGRLVKSLRTAIDHHRLKKANAILQDQLKESEETFRELFHNANDAIFLCEACSKSGPGLLNRINNVGRSLLEYKADDHGGRTIIDFISQEHRSHAAAQLAQVNSGKRVTFETVLVSTSGRPVPVEISANLFSVRNGKMVLCIARDVSERHALERALADTIEKERRTMGQEIHDSICQDLTSITMLISLIRDSVPPIPGKAQEDARTIHELATNAVSVCRRMHSGMFPSSLELSGLASALEDMTLINQRIFRVPCTFTSDGNVEPENRNVSLQLYRIAQEAVTNAAKHSGCRRIAVSITARPPLIVLAIEDDGVGMDINLKKESGRGISIMHYRARMIDAALEISSTTGKGTKVTCIWNRTV